MNNDLISRSALKEKVIGEFNEIAHKAHFRLFADVLRAKQAVLRLLDEATAVVAEPVRHGRWILNKHYGDYECSECGAGDFTALDFKQHNMNYCPNCGVRMER